MSISGTHSPSTRRLLRVRIVLFTAAVCLAGLPSVLTAQRTQTASDSARTKQLLDVFAVMTSGVWLVDGEFKSATGEYQKLSGYFAFVTSTPTSKDNGDAAVLSMYLEPMAGGIATWLGVRLSCRMTADLHSTQCTPQEGAKSLLDLNFLLKGVPYRGSPIDGEISEPDVKSYEERFTSKSTPRGRFTLRAPD